MTRDFQDILTLGIKNTIVVITSLDLSFEKRNPKRLAYRKFMSHHVNCIYTDEIKLWIFISMTEICQR